MKNKKIQWYIINKNYINYLKQFDSKVQNINYSNTSKPYLGIIFNINNFNYYVPISSVKSKHYSMSNNVDFIKIINNNKILSVINLNNMIPIPESETTLLEYDNSNNNKSVNWNPELTDQTNWPFTKIFLLYLYKLQLSKVLLKKQNQLIVL